MEIDIKLIRLCSDQFKQLKIKKNYQTNMNIEFNMPIYNLNPEK